MPLVGSGNSFGGISGSNAAARLLVVISGTSAPLSAALAQAQGSLGGFSKSASAIGSAMTRSITLPLAALGGAALMLASNFESMIARIAGLTPIAEQLEGGIGEVRSRLLELANDPQVTAGPQELAESLYFAGSAGLQAEEAFQVVKLSAQGMSVGMGEAADISKLLIFALNNYRSTGLNAATAMDVLTAAIREGTAAPDEMAIALGRLLPIAAKAGITFQQVVGSVSALTNLGVPVRVATTSLRALFSQLLAPTIQATELLDQLGVSAEELRGALTQGPIAAFQLLEKATKGNTDQLHDLIPQIRAITAYYSLSGTNAERYNEILEQVNHSQGFFAKTLTEISKTPGFQFEKSLQQLKVAGIQLGTTLFPVFRTIASIILEVADSFQALPGPVKTATAALLVASALAGPLLQLVGAITATKEATLAMGAAGTTTVPTVKALATGFLTAGIAATVAFSGFQKLLGGTASLATVISTAIGTMVALKLAFTALQTAANAGAFGVNAFSLALAGLGGPIIAVVIAGITAIGLAIAYTIGEARRLDNLAKDLKSTLVSSGQAGETFSAGFEGLADGNVADELGRVAKQLGLVNEQINISNLEKFREGIGEGLADSLTGIATAVPQSREFVDNLSELPALIRAGASQGLDLNEILKGTGQSVDTVLDNLGDLKQAANDDPQNKALIEGIENQFLAYNEAGSARDALIQQTEGILTANSEEEKSLQQLADRYGVSTSYMGDQLTGLGVTAEGALASNQEEFSKAAFGIDQFGNAVSGSAAEARDAIAEMAASMSQNLQGTLGLFDEFPEKIKDSAAQLSTHAAKMSQIAVQQTQSILALSRRGVPTGLINEILEKGPAALAKFASSSDTELKKLVTAYSVRLGAMDDEILKEAQHEKEKGKDMVRGFAAAVLSSKALPLAAADGIIGAVTESFNKGDLTSKGVGMVTSLVNGLGSQTGITQAQGQKIVLAFAEGLASGDYVNQKGQLLVNQLATKLAHASGIAKNKAVQIVQAIAQGIGEKSPTAIAQMKTLQDKMIRELQTDGFHTVGLNLMQQLAAGVTSGTGIVENAVSGAIAAIKASAHNSLKNSPEYFTYYMGEKLMKDMDRGMKKGHGQLHGYSPSVTMGGRSGSGSMRGMRVEIIDSNLGVRMQGIVVGELDDQRTYQGRLDRRRRHKVKA